jgi:uncharacterized protein YprB with RNaseH-like and TPR domain
MTDLSEKLERLRALRGAHKAPVQSFDPDADARKSSLVRALDIRRGLPPQRGLDGVEVAPGVLESSGTFVPFSRAEAAPSVQDKLGALRQLLAAKTRPTAAALQQALQGANTPVPAPHFAPDWHQDAPIHARQIVGFDTETTGLLGHSNAMVFMLGIAYFDDHSWRTKQWTLLQASGAAAMYARFCAALPAAPQLVSYNGIRFDIPMMQADLRLHGISLALRDFGHWDLLYPTRKRFRSVWPNCKLQTLEQRLLNFHRLDDVPGSEAPLAWRSYLQRGETRRLAGILEHNRHDLISLIEGLMRLSPGNAPN